MRDITGCVPDLKPRGHIRARHGICCTGAAARPPSCSSSEEQFMIEPWWPLAVLAFIQLGDALMCIKPVAFIRQCLVDVGYPRRYWWVLPPLKIAAAAGLAIGIWYRPLAILTTGALVCYFVIALVSHLRARDLGRNLFLNCTGMLALCTATFVYVIVV
jgi:hypothetical protein